MSFFPYSIKPSTLMKLSRCLLFHISTPPPAGLVSIFFTQCSKPPVFQPQTLQSCSRKHQRAVFSIIQFFQACEHITSDTLKLRLRKYFSKL